MDISNRKAVEYYKLSKYQLKLRNTVDAEKAQLYQAKINFHANNLNQIMGGGIMNGGVDGQQGSTPGSASRPSSPTTGSVASAANPQKKSGQGSATGSATKPTPTVAPTTGPTTATPGVSGTTTNRPSAESKTMFQKRTEQSRKDIETTLEQLRKAGANNRLQEQTRTIIDGTDNATTSFHGVLRNFKEFADESDSELRNVNSELQQVKSSVDKSIGDDEFEHLKQRYDLLKKYGNFDLSEDFDYGDISKFKSKPQSVIEQRK